MKKSLFNQLLDIGDRIKEPIFTEEYHDSSEIIDKLQTLIDKTNDKKIIDEFEMDIRFIKAGDFGEKNVYYELKNSFLPIIVLHDVLIQYDDYQAQLDFVVVTHKFICILETKKLNGNITINNNGEFIRSIINKHGKVIKKEGMYSPISQNRRHVRIIQNMLLKEKIIKKTPIYSLVVMANPKSIINSKYANKEIKKEIIKYDLLTDTLKKMLKKDSVVEISNSNMRKIADYIQSEHVVKKNEFVRKYERKISESIDDKTEEILKTTNTVVEDKVVKKSDYIRKNTKIQNSKPSIDTRSSNLNVDKIREKLIEFRLNRSREDHVKAYIIFNNKQLDGIINAMPKSIDELTKCDGFGPIKVKKYGEEILRIINK